MKIAVKNIKPNPFRNIENYPIDREKVELLKASIKETDFWDNIIVRKKDNHYFELAYGHHRLEALKELGIKEINIPVKELDDAQMIKIMANENLDEWRHNTAVINETVLAAKTFLDGELAKDDKLGTSNSFIRGLFESQRAFETTKGLGVGQTTILKFLGGAWKQYQIQRALTFISDEKIAREAIEIFEEPIHAETFRELCSSKTNRISANNMLSCTLPDLLFNTKEEQLEVAKNIKKRLVETNREITRNAIQDEFKKIMNERMATKDEELVLGMTEEELVDEYFSGKAEDLISLLQSFTKKVKKLKKEIAENEPTYDRDLLKKEIFYPVIIALEETVSECNYDLLDLLKNCRSEML
ncbi:MAG: ParB/RepB/Spo0J family partition protein [Spirochaetia bacterium]|nr:ParB/RepB/Spo0J family partition protein [Spirochaetia bacterium]